MIYALGAFDGFHIGHRRLLARAAERSAGNGGWGVITFDGHPRAFLHGGRVRMLFTRAERDIAARHAGVRDMKKILFTREFADLSPEGFADFIAERYDVSGLVIGENFRFAKDRAGTPQLLGKICALRGWSLDVIPSYRLNGCVVSSTEVRKAVSEGKMRCAAELLGHPFMISGEVSHGDERGRGIGFRTANIRMLEDKVYPPYGVYAALVFLDGVWRKAAVNIGDNPTFGCAEARCEAHILEYEGDLYGKRLLFFITGEVRGEIKFGSAQELSSQISRDTEQCIKLCSEYMSRSKNTMDGFAVLL
ncbi:MAG: riboflavin biosynthesis protein RibF [Synergistes sp.]|nr:riboflavin biosynthesis protein RibF [Synergistes sp.]